MRDEAYPWTRLRAVVAAIAGGVHNRHFVQDGLDALCTTLGAASAWSTLQSKNEGHVHRSRSNAFAGVSPAEVAAHTTEILEKVESRGRSMAGRLPFAESGSFTSVPLWSHPATARRDARLVGAVYLDFVDGRGTQGSVIEFVECVGALLGAVVAQQALVESAREDLREKQATYDPSRFIELDELLEPESMRSIREDVYAAIRSNASIVILGESGTGKTQLATAIATASNRTPIVRATLGFSDDLNTITSELFGHERGAFSGAISRRKGLVEYADGGTLILDEILNLPPHAQQLLLDFTQFGTYRPLGYQGREPRRARVRLISATNGHIKQAINDTRFRQDLYVRLATGPLTLPPLRERRADIPEIALHYLAKADPRKQWRLSDDAQAMLVAPHLEWAGNIRELESVLERARNRACNADAETCTLESRHLDLKQAEARLMPKDANGGAESPEIGERWQQLAVQRAELDSLEREIIRAALHKCKGVVARTARELSLSRTSLISRMATLDIKNTRGSSEPAG